jgi:hypothetical protein
MNKFAFLFPTVRQLAAAAAGAISERCRPRTHKVTGVASMPYNRKARRGRGANAAGCSKMPEGVVLVGGKGGTKDAAYAFARYIPTHTPAHIHTHCLSPSLAHTHTHTHMHAHKRALSHSHTQSHTHTCQDVSKKGVQSSAVNSYTHGSFSLPLFLSLSLSLSLSTHTHRKHGYQQ